MNELPIYVKVDILVQATNEEFSKLCQLNKEFNYLCSGIVPIEISTVHGNLSERMYSMRSERLFDKKIYSLKDSSVTWKEFYERVQAFYKHWKVDSIQNIINYVIENTNFEIKLLNLMNYPNLENILDDDMLEYAVMKGNMPMILWLNKRGINTYTEDMLDYSVTHGNIPMIEFLEDINFEFDVNHYLKRAARNLQFDAMEWMYKRHVLNKPVKIDVDINILRKNPMLKTIIWRNVTDAERIKILEWYESKGVYPNLYDYDSLSLKNNMNKAVVDWINSKELIRYSLNYAGYQVV